MDGPRAILASVNEFFQFDRIYLVRAKNTFLVRRLKYKGTLTAAVPPYLLAIGRPRDGHLRFCDSLIRPRPPALLNIYLSSK